MLDVKEVVGIDRDRAAIKAARENARINGVEDFVNFVLQDASDKVTGNYSLVVANLLPHIIYKVLPNLISVVQNNGFLILSGIIEEETEGIATVLVNSGFNLLEEVKLNEWVSLVARKD